MSRPRASLRELELLFRELAAAARAGLPLREALAILQQDDEYGRYGRLVAILAARIQQTSTLSSALADPAARFPAETVEAVRRAEAGHILPDALEALAGDYERRAVTDEAVSAVMWYPAAIAVVVVLVLYLVAVFVMPAFDVMYASFGGDVYRPGALLANSGPVLMAVASALLAAGVFVVWMTSSRERAPRALVAFWDAVRSRLPVFGAFSKKAFEVRAAAILGVAASRDAGFAAAMLSHLRATSENRKLGRWIPPLVERLSSGENLIQSMRATPAVPRRISAMLELGAKSGDLGAAREQLTAWYDVMLQTSARTFQYRAMVLLYVVLMAVVGAMLIAVYVPIFGLAAIV